MKTRLSITAQCAMFVCISLCTSCQQFFTTSLASPLARKSYNISATLPVSQAIDLLDMAIAQGDSALAAALVTPLLAAVTATQGDPTSPAYNEAASALLSAVVLSSGVGTAVTSIAERALSGDDPSTLLAALETVSINDIERESLILLANKPPLGMSDDDAYIAAVALAIDAFTSTGYNLEDIDALSLSPPAALVNSPSMIAALQLLDAAQAGGNGSPFGSLFEGFDFSAFS